MTEFVPKMDDFVPKITEFFKNFKKLPNSQKSRIFRIKKNKKSTNLLKNQPNHVV